MMNTFLRLFGSLALVAALAACGGGGGSPGTTVPNTGSGGSGGGGVVVDGSTTDGSITLVLTAADGSVIANGALSQTQEAFLRATVVDSNGAFIGGARVEFELDSIEAVLVPANGVALTAVGTGVASIKVAPASVGSQGVVTAKATATLNGAAISKELFLNIAQGSVQLQNLTATPDTLEQGSALSASVEVLINGARAPSNSVAVNFSSTCGAASPASAVVDGNGRATSSVQTNRSGSCIVTASYNSVSIQRTFTVTRPPLTSIEFVSATPQVIFQEGSTGATTANVIFRVIDSLGNPVAGAAVTGALTNADGGIDFCGSPFTSLPTGANGQVRFAVCSGTLPATVQVRASLDAFPGIPATFSNLLSIQTGLPTQRSFDISSTQLNFYAGGFFTDRFNNNFVEITVNAADRQSNPVPQGTQIVFVAEGGQLTTAGNSSCVIGSDGSCSVRLFGQDYRPLGSNVPGADPRPGRVTVLAYTDGEESYIDANNNNRYDPGEIFEDLGFHFIDKDEDGVRTAAYTNLVTGTSEGESSFPLPSGASGTVACPPNIGFFSLSVQNSCNGRWDALTKVRRSIVIVFSGGEIGDPNRYHPTIPLDKRTSILEISRAGARIRLADLDGNPLPSNAALSVEVPGGGCSAQLSAGNVVGNRIEPSEHVILFTRCGGGETVLLKARVQDKETALSITVP